MITSLTKIGNSKGIIIPAKILAQFQIEDSVAVYVKDDTLVISKPKLDRSSWGDAFSKLSVNDNEQLISDDLSNDFDDEWTW